MKLKKSLLCLLLLLFLRIEPAPVEQVMIENPVILTACMTTVPYLFNTLFSIYAKKNPSSYLPVVARCFFVHPSKVCLVVSGLLRIIMTYNFNKIQSYFGILSEKNKKNDPRKLEHYSIGTLQILLGVLLTYACYNQL